MDLNKAAVREPVPVLVACRRVPHYISHAVHSRAEPARSFAHQHLQEVGIVLAVTVLFFVGAESWNWAKREVLRKRGLMHKWVLVRPKRISSKRCLSGFTRLDAEGLKKPST